MKKIITSLILAALLFSIVPLNSQAEANTVNQLVPMAPNDSDTDGIQPYGTKPPGSNASIHNISISPYNYQVARMGSQLYTDKFIQGKTIITVSINNWNVLKDLGGSTKDLTIYLHDSTGKTITSRKPTITANGSALTAFTGLSSTAKYSVSFLVPRNGNQYSFLIYGDFHQCLKMFGSFFSLYTY